MSNNENAVSGSSAVSDLLSGFEVVASDSVPHISLDKQRRFYLNSSTRRLLDVKPYDRVVIAYNPAERLLAIIKPSANTGLSDVSTSNYTLDKRYYMSARHFANNYGYPAEQAPYMFDYDRGSSDGKVFIFRLRK